MSGWRDLEAMLDAAAARGKAIRLWWRDDDAGRSDPALARLLELADSRAVPLALAVVPLWLDDETQAWIAGSCQATVLQHGYAHQNHAPSGAKRIELGTRDPDAIRRELERGRELLCDVFGATFLALLVPPWNRLDPELIGHLTSCGFRGLSTFGRRQEPHAAPGLVRLNAHLDPIEWRGSRLFVGEGAALARLCEALDLEEPIGILSHHLVLDEAGWRFLDRLLGVLAEHPGARLCSAGELLEAP